MSLALHYPTALRTASCRTYASDAPNRRTQIKASLPIRSTFNIVMRIISSRIGVAMVLMGTVWILQGLNLAFRVGFMVGNYHWTIYGAILALVGIAQVIWSNTRQGKT
jgi:hypothetical protein